MFMEIGFCHNYKHVLKYFLTNSGTLGTCLVDIIFIVTKRLQDIGLKVVVTVYELRLNNQKSYILLGVQSDQPFHSANGQIIV